LNHLHQGIDPTCRLIQHVNSARSEKFFAREAGMLLVKKQFLLKGSYDGKGDYWRNDVAGWVYE
jgi:hypothetical protein